MATALSVEKNTRRIAGDEGYRASQGLDGLRQVYGRSHGGTSAVDPMIDLDTCKPRLKLFVARHAESCPFQPQKAKVVQFGESVRQRTSQIVVLV